MILQMQKADFFADTLRKTSVNNQIVKRLLVYCGLISGIIKDMRPMIVIINITENIKRQYLLLSTSNA